MTFLQLIGVIGAFTIFVLVSWWCIKHDCSNNAQWKRAMEKMTEEKFPYMWKQTQPTIDTFMWQKLNELEREIKKLKKELDKLRNYDTN